MMMCWAEMSVPQHDWKCRHTHQQARPCFPVPDQEARVGVVVGALGKDAEEVTRRLDGIGVPARCEPVLQDSTFDRCRMDGTGSEGA